MRKLTIITCRTWLGDTTEGKNIYEDQGFKAPPPTIEYTAFATRLSIDEAVRRMAAYSRAYKASTGNRFAWEFEIAAISQIEDDYEPTHRGDTGINGGPDYIELLPQTADEIDS